MKRKERMKYLRNIFLGIGFLGSGIGFLYLQVDLIEAMLIGFSAIALMTGLLCHKFSTGELTFA